MNHQEKVLHEKLRVLKIKLNDVLEEFDSVGMEMLLDACNIPENLSGELADSVGDAYVINSRVDEILSRI